MKTFVAANIGLLVGMAAILRVSCSTGSTQIAPPKVPMQEPAASTPVLVFAPTNIAIPTPIAAETNYPPLPDHLEVVCNAGKYALHHIQMDILVFENENLVSSNAVMARFLGIVGTNAAPKIPSKQKGWESCGGSTNRLNDWQVGVIDGLKLGHHCATKGGTWEDILILKAAIEANDIALIKEWGKAWK